MSFRPLSMILTASMVLAVPARSAPTHSTIQLTPERTLIERALRDPLRASDRQQDATRRPAELVALARLRPGQRVLDLIPGSGYWTRIFSRIVGAEGHVYAVWPAAYARLATGDVDTLRRESQASGNVTVDVQQQPLPTAPVPLDVVWTSQNYHDYADAFLGKPGPDALARDAFRLLRPGGIFVVIDHRSASGRGTMDTDTLHRIDPAIVKRQVEAAGFVFAGESRALVNPADPLTVKVFDPTIRGRTSQFAFAFRRPAAAER